MSPAEAVAVADALTTARRIRRRLDATSAQSRALRRLEEAARFAVEDGDGSAAESAIADWRRLVHRILDARRKGKPLTGRPSEIGFVEPSATTPTAPRNQLRRR